MSKGYPDYFGYSMFPSYGDTTIVKRIATTISPSAYLQYLTASFKGVLFSGYIRFIDVDNPALATIRLDIDGVVVFDNSLLVMLQQGYYGLSKSMLQLDMYDVETPKYTAAFDLNIPVRESVSLYVKKSSGADMVVSGEFRYSHIKT